MQYTNTIARQPILIGLLLSIAIHVAVLKSRSLYTAPIPQMATGRTVVQLTLLPSRSSPASETEAIQPTAPKAQAPRPVPQSTPEPVEKTAVDTSAPDSIAQDATLEEDKGVITEAEATSAFHPIYPRISKRRGETGTVILSVQVLENGSVGKAAILRSSGFRRLDEAAVKGALQTIFTPAVRMGHSVESTTQLSYTFRLTDD